MIDIQIPPMMEKKIHALIEVKYYPSISEAVKDAFRTLFATKPTIKIISAIHLYTNNEVSVSKAAEIAGVSIEEFKEILASRGVKREIYPDERVDENVRMILKHTTNWTA
ncbi:MAG: UPF0175 family protein [Candidatus Methanospirareceae archaeon]